MMFHRVFSVTNGHFKTYGFTSRIAATENTHAFVVGPTNMDNSSHPTPTPHPHHEGRTKVHDPCNRATKQIV